MNSSVRAGCGLHVARASVVAQAPRLRWSGGRPRPSDQRATEALAGLRQPHYSVGRAGCAPGCRCPTVSFKGRRYSVTFCRPTASAQTTILPRAANSWRFPEDNQTIQKAKTQSMKRTSTLFTTLLALATGAVLTLGAASVAQAADATGTWTWSRPGRQGGEAQKMTLTLKADGEKLTGTLTSPGRQGGDPVKTEISDGKVKGDEVSFSVTREYNGNKMTTKYSGKVSADTIKGTVERPARGGGDPTKTDWEAKREAK